MLGCAGAFSENHIYTRVKNRCDDNLINITQSLLSRYYNRHEERPCKHVTYPGLFWTILDQDTEVSGCFSSVLSHCFEMLLYSNSVVNTEYKKAFR